jgi:hypothetical protein
LWISKAISYGELDWENIGDPNTLTLMDPIEIIDRRCFVLSRETCESLWQPHILHYGLKAFCKTLNERGISLWVKGAYANLQTAAHAGE